MALTIEQNLSFLRERVLSALKWVPEARAKHDYSWCAENLSSAFRNATLIGLIEWRRGIESFRTDLAQAVEIARNAIDILAGAEWEDHWKSFDFASATVISYLLDGEFDLNLRAQLPPRHEWRVSPIEGSGPVLDTGLITAMAEGKIPPELEASLARMTKNKRVKLAHETYANYVEILRRCVQGEPIEDLVREAEELFLKRKKNAYYYSAPTEGGGPDNDYVVDYKLAAILKWCESRSPSSRVETIHAWRW